MTHDLQTGAIESLNELRVRAQRAMNVGHPKTMIVTQPDAELMLERWAALDKENRALLAKLRELEAEKGEWAFNVLDVLVEVRQYLDAARAEEQKAATWSEWDERMHGRCVALCLQLDAAHEASLPSPEDVAGTLT